MSKDILMDILFDKAPESESCVICEKAEVQESDFDSEDAIKEWQVSATCQECQDDIPNISEDEGFEWGDDIFSDSDAAFF